MSSQHHSNQRKNDSRLVAMPADSQKVKQKKAKVAEPKGRKLYSFQGDSPGHASENVKPLADSETLCALVNTTFRACAARNRNCTLGHHLGSAVSTQGLIRQCVPLWW